MESEYKGDGNELGETEVLDFLRDQNWPVTSKQTGQALGADQQSAYYWLRKLKDSGLVERKKVSYNVVLWRAI